MKDMHYPELLAPAGDYSCFESAIGAGADAVYLGSSYSARAYARNFTQDELLRALDLAHLHGKKIYLTLNIVMKDPELDGICSFLDPFYRAGLDGVIVQDIGLISLIRTAFPDLPVHASTQMCVTDAEGIRLLEDLGVKRVVPARELSLREIGTIREKTDMELECFIHGALCYSYSGKCLLSSLIGGRSGNRGRCAQPCRLPYDGVYPLSCKDICTLKILPQLICAGITSFKIEGRMKSADYVANVTRIYRKYIDLFLTEPEKPYRVDKEDLKRLIALYTRGGNCEGYYRTKNGPEMITMTEGGYKKGAKPSGREDHVTPDPLSVDLSVRIKEGERAALSLTLDEVSVTVTGDIVQTARTKALSEEETCDRMRKFGNTPFAVRSVRTEIGDSVFMSVSSLNALRRDGVAALKKALLAPYERAGCSFDPEAWKNRIIQKCGEKESLCETRETLFETAKIHVSVLDAEQAETVLSLSAADILSVPFTVFENEKERIRSAWSLAKKQPRIYLAFPDICRDSFFERKSALITEFLSDPMISGVLAKNYETLYFLKQAGFTGTVLADLHLYAANRAAVCTLLDLGATMTTVPVELNRKELILRNVKGEDLIVYGRLPLMVSAQCVQKTTDGCAGSDRLRLLHDRFGNGFPVFSFCEECVNVLFNSVPLSLHGEDTLTDKISPASLRLSFTTEKEKEIRKICELFMRSILQGSGEPLADGYTKGHLQRGVE